MADQCAASCDVRILPLGETNSKEGSWASQLTWSRKTEGTKACWKRGEHPEVLRVDRDRKARVLWQRLDCLKSNPDLVPQRPIGKTPETGVLPCRPIVISGMHPSG